MRANDIEMGEHYRHKDTPTYGWARALKVLKPKEAENPHNRIIVKCEWSTTMNAKFGIIKYFKPSDLMKA